MGGYFHPPLSSLCSTVFFIFVHKSSKRRRRTRRIKKLLYRRASSSAIFISTSRVAQLICLCSCRNSASVFSPKTNQNLTISFYWPTESLFCLSVCLSIYLSLNPPPARLRRPHPFGKLNNNNSTPANLDFFTTSRFDGDCVGTRVFVV